MPIQLLPPRLANQIAAGEVVERPASVVKELLENSLDAGATRIELDIERGGHKRIRLRDNGCGIEKNELELALSRHATSKIATLNDLERILSLGFRGEALASISSVSRLTLTSKPGAQREAWQASCEGRDMTVTVTPAAHPDGSTIDVADLFYNTPARRKFLRAEKTEFQHIEEVIKRVALSHPQVSFSLKHNGKSVRRYTAVAADKHHQRIAQVVGQKFIDNATHVALDYQGMAIEAWLGNENVTRSSNDCQYSFVNNRAMRDKLIMHAIRQAYESAYGYHEQPSFVVYLTVDPAQVDVNVHPAKHEVRFQQSRLVHDFIVKTVSDALAPPTANNAEGAVQDAGLNHDYIRPLAATGATPQSHPLDAPSQSTQAGDWAEGWAQAERPTFGSAGASARGRTGGSRAGGAGPRGNSVSEAYRTSYSQLMTPNSDSVDNPAEQLNALILTPRQRIVASASQVWLIDAEALLGQWWLSVLENSQTSQPLLMPVAIENTAIAEETVTLLNDLGFVINQVAGKLRLQQVPAGSRHLPWVSLFPALVSVKADNQATLATALAELELSWPAQVHSLIWQWFDAQALAKRWDWVREFGRVRTLEQLLQKWDEPDV